MTGIDDVDYEILELLMADARRSYREIAEAVDRSPPTVSERVERLQDLGIIERFTLGVDRSMLIEGPTVLVELAVEPGSDEAVADRLADVSAVEHVIRTVDAMVVFVAHASFVRDRDGWGLVPSAGAVSSPASKPPTPRL